MQLHSESRSNISPEQTFVVLGVLLQFLSVPEHNGSDISLIKGTLQPAATIPLHSHPDPEICYILEGSLDVYRADTAAWVIAKTGETISIPGNLRHAVRNPADVPATTITTTKADLYSFFLELAQPFRPDAPMLPPTPADMAKVFAVAAKYEYRMGTPEDNADIGVSLG